VLKYYLVQPADLKKEELIKLALTCGIIGLPMVGKTTLFNLMTNADLETSKFFSGKTETNAGIAKIPDERIDFLSRLYKPKKTTYAQLELLDVPGLVQGASQGQGIGNQFLASIRKADALVHVVRAFQDKDIAYVEDSVDPVRDWETLEVELLFADLELIEKRIERINTAKKKTKENEAELPILHKLKDALEENIPISKVELKPEETELLHTYDFFTEKPMIAVVNLDEGQFRTGDYPGKEALAEITAAKGSPLLELCVQTEMEISQLSEEDREVFFEEMGITQPGISRLARMIYEKLGLISFFTVGEDEVRAWTINANTNAKKAGGKIHSDIERGFIRAEVVKYADLKELGSMAQVKEKGLFRLEGKEYIVQDSDIINFRFNV
jgi:GTP-binding protein YchF